MSTWRSDVRDGLYAHLVAFKATQAAMVAGDIYKVRPGSLVPPSIYIGSLNEPRITQTPSVRQREMFAEVVLVQRLIVPTETGEAMDDMVDAFLDWLDDNVRVHIGGGIISTVSSRDVELDFAGTIYSATVVTVKAEVQEGRN